MTHPRSAATGWSKRTSSSPDSILFAFTDEQRPRASLLHACVLARELHAQLHVLMVVKPRQPFAPVVPLRVQRVRAARWLAELLGGNGQDCLQLSSGPFVRDVAHRARQLDARLIVAVRDRRRFGWRAARLARRAAVSVMVTDDLASVGSTIVAATDLADPVYPVLHEAGTLRGVLHGPVVAVHNLNPFQLAREAGLFRSLFALRSQAHAGEVERRTRQLAQAARTGVQGGAEVAILASRIRTVDAILQAANAYGAHLIIVGTRAQSWFRRLWGRALAARVVNRAHCLVLITPIRALRTVRRSAVVPEEQRIIPAV